MMTSDRSQFLPYCPNILRIAQRFYASHCFFFSIAKQTKITFWSIFLSIWYEFNFLSHKYFCYSKTLNDDDPPGNQKNPGIEFWIFLSIVSELRTKMSKKETKMWIVGVVQPHAEYPNKNIRINKNSVLFYLSLSLSVNSLCALRVLWEFSFLNFYFCIFYYIQYRWVASGLADIIHSWALRLK